MPPVDLELDLRYRRARERRRPFEPVWRDCLAFTMPQRMPGLEAAPGRGSDRLFDATAADAVEQLAASLLGELTPPGSPWFGLRAGPQVASAERPMVTEALEAVAARLQGAFDHANFTVEIHQAFLDLVTLGTATLLFAEAPAGRPSPFRFSAIPATEMAIEEDVDGAVVGHFRTSTLPLAGLRSRWPDAVLPPDLAAGNGEQPCRVIEAVVPGGTGFDYRAWLTDDDGSGRAMALLADGRFEHSPFITFRWVKTAGEVYGRSPMMTALPDVRTANKVVELILKNASIAVTGIWLAEDDGVLNPANIKLVPGSIIPKAVGSEGLKPLEMPGRFDVSQLILDDLRARIRHTLLVDRLGPVQNARMTATEVLERSAETTRLLAAVFGRLQAELLTPLVARGLAILARRGEIPDVRLDGRMVELRYQSPLARRQSRQDVQNTLLWLESVRQMGDHAASVVDLPGAARWLGHTLGVPAELIREQGLLDAFQAEFLREVLP
ncbi:portal protein [Geminicoccus harenae]|uniref:portal protein n=2 Tax=Geminicoccus harenae TaxID=2498453 RepID=UPI001C94BE35|nr:portal protein [Geminicoccus harenae]